MTQKPIIRADVYTQVGRASRNQKKGMRASSSDVLICPLGFDQWPCARHPGVFVLSVTVFLGLALRFVSIKLILI